MKTDAPKVKNPHPLMQCGTPSIDIEADHIMQFMVFRMGGSQPIHVKNIPRDVTDPLYIKRQVGGGRYQLKAQAEGATSGKTHGSVLGATIYEWDGQPIMDAPPQTPFAPSAAHQPLMEQMSSQLPAVATALGALGTTVLAFLSEARNARADQERRVREYEDAKAAREKEERERRETRERAEAEERREKERQRDEERRERERADAEERRADRERMEQARLEQQRAEAEARAARETQMMTMLFQRPDPNSAIMNVLLERALNPPAPPPPANPTASVDSVLDAAKKLKEFTDGDGDEKMVIAGLQALASPAGSKIIDMAAGFLGRRPPQEVTEQPVVPPEPAPMEQLPPPVEQAPLQPQPEFTPGPVTIN